MSIATDAAWLATLPPGKRERLATILSGAEWPLPPYSDRLPSLLLTDESDYATMLAALMEAPPQVSTYIGTLAVGDVAGLWALPDGRDGQAD